MAKRQNYDRQSFESVRSAERSRLRELERVGALFGLADVQVRNWYEDGSDPVEVEAKLSDRRAQQNAVAVMNLIESDPAGGLSGPAAVDLLVREFFGRSDVSVNLGDAERIGGRFGRDALARVSGVRGGGADPWVVLNTVVRSAGPMGLMTTGGRVDFMSGAGALPAASQAAAVRDALDLITLHDWNRTGAFWRAGCRLFDSPDLRDRRWWLAMGAVPSSATIPEGGEPLRVLRTRQTRPCVRAWRLGWRDR